MRQCAPAKNRTKIRVSDRAGVLGWGQRKGVVGRETSGLWMRAVHARAHGTLATREIKKEAEKGQGERARIESTRNARNVPHCLHCHALATSQRMRSSATRHRAPNAFARACCTSHSQGGQLLSASRSRGHDFPTLLRVAATVVVYTYFSREGFLCRAYSYSYRFIYGITGKESL